MGLVDDLNPTNYQEEKQRFLNNPTFNPQFHYKREFSQEELSRHGFPADGYQQLAQRIIDATFQQFTPHELQAQRGRLLTQDKVTAAIQQFLQAHSLENRFPIVWSDKFVSRASIDAHGHSELSRAGAGQLRHQPGLQGGNVPDGSGWNGGDGSIPSAGSIPIARREDHQRLTRSSRRGPLKLGSRWCVTD